MGETASLTRLLQPFVPVGNVAPWAVSLRDSGQAEFDSVGLPNRRVEAWRYSNLANALGEKPRPQSPARAAPAVPGAFVIAFEDGRLTSDLASPPPGVDILPLADVLADPTSPFADLLGRTSPDAHRAVVGLNASHLQEGVVIQVLAQAIVRTPLHIRSTWTGSQTGHLRMVVVLEEGAEATVLETHTGAPAFATVVTDLSLAPTSRLTHARLEQLGASARQTAVTSATVAEGAQYKAFYLSEGAHFARHEALLELAGEAADATIDGAYLVADGRHCDNTTVIVHAAPNTTSRQAFRGVLSGKSRGVYQGCVKVRRVAQQTDARQMSRALLLSRKAEMITKPELEIFADDVKCAHGATTGELDEAALFFLRARGIGEAEARAMLIEAFLGEALDTIENEALRAPAAAAVQDWLSAHASDVRHAE
jgi:Fe-S cluster assembly protein SufD